MVRRERSTLGVPKNSGFGNSGNSEDRGPNFIGSGAKFKDNHP
jgi:hypothetical protein